MHLERETARAFRTFVGIAHVRRRAVRLEDGVKLLIAPGAGDEAIGAHDASLAFDDCYLPAMQGKTRLQIDSDRSDEEMHGRRRSPENVAG